MRTDTGGVGETGIFNEEGLGGIEDKEGRKSVVYRKRDLQKEENDLVVSW